MEKLDFELYNGEVTVEFDDPTHTYRITDRGAVAKPTSVTTILGVVNKPPLMQWAVNQAIEHLRNRLYTEEEHTLDDIDLYLDEAKYAHQARKKEAADIGTLAHNWLEAYWKNRLYGEDLPPRPDHPLANNCIEAALKFMAEHDVQPLVIERPVYSRKLNIIGRLDMYGEVNGKIAVLDWKSSTGLWPEYLLQTGAYCKFIEEETGQLPQERWLVKLGKNDGEFHAQRVVGQIQEDYEAFAAAVTLYRRLQALNKLSRR